MHLTMQPNPALLDVTKEQPATRLPSDSTPAFPPLQAEVVLALMSLM